VAKRRVRRDTGAKQRGSARGIKVGRNIQDEVFIDDDLVGIAAQGLRLSAGLCVRASVGHGEAVLAVVLVPFLAAGAGVARIDETADGNPLANLHLLDVVADLRHAADDLVAGKAWKDRHSPFVACEVNVRMANATELDGDLNVPPSRRAAFELKRGKGRISRQGCISFGEHGASIH
jgi:hypothetical protein